MVYFTKILLFKGDIHMQVNKDEINSKRLLLRRLRPDDYEAYCEILMQREVTRWLGNGKDNNRENIKAVMNKFEKLWEENGYGVWAVITKENNELIGHCGFLPIANSSEVELLYAFSPKCWGHGYATEAAEAAVACAKDIYKWKSLVALAYHDNKSSVNVLNKLGFKYIEDQEHFGVKLAYFNLILN